MDEMKVVTFNIEHDIAEKFNIALMLNKEDGNEVVTQLIIGYIAESFSNASKDLIPQNENVLNDNKNRNENYAKAMRKIPTWARKPHQNNHKIIKAYFQIQEEKGVVNVDELAERCSDSENYKSTYCADFKGNFAQMKTDAGNSHGKVFVVEDTYVEIWEVVEELLMKNKELFVKSSDRGKGMSKITKEMTAIAYDYAKKVFAEEMTRSEAKLAIERESGMNIGSALDYVSDFIAMMNGESYVRTMANMGTVYFLENIRKDYGDKAFMKAIEATEKHIEYYNALGNGNLKTKGKIVKQFRESMGRDY